MTKEEKGAVYDRAIKLLSNQDYSEFKIKKKLASLGLNSEKINLAIEKIKKENIINDDRYKKNVVRKLIYKGFSPVLIKKKLNLDGLEISSEEITTLFQEEGFTTKRQIEILVEKKLKKYPSLENEKENHKLKNKVMSFILSKGHEYEEALSFLEDHF